MYVWPEELNQWISKSLIGLQASMKVEITWSELYPSKRGLDAFNENLPDFCGLNLIGLCVIICNMDEKGIKRKIGNIYLSVFKNAFESIKTALL